LVINEVSPVAPRGDHPWFELHNPTSGLVELSGMIVRTAAGSRYVIPDLSGLPEERRAIDRAGYVQVVLDDGDDSAGLDRSSSGLLLHAPSALASAWSPSGGELVLYRTAPGDPSQLEPLDYVAWGRPGQPWSRIDRGLLWPRTGFVLLAGSFGIYDSNTEIASGASIGLYPGASVVIAPEDWVLFDADEVTPGFKNGVPRPKVFTLPNGVEIGSQSFAVGWVRNRGDEWYHFELAADPDFETIVAEERSIMPVFRLGEDPGLRKVYYRARAYSDGRQSLPSRTGYAMLYVSPCDWPLPPSPTGPRPTPVGPPQPPAGLATLAWLTNPTCSPPTCRLIRTIRFKFQRKDTPLRCCYDHVESPTLEPQSGCPWAAPHPYCHKVTLLNRPSYTLCAEGQLSPLCGVWPLTPSGGGLAYPSPEPVFAPELQLEPYIRSERSCPHGEENCVRASIAMIASAYGGHCLSQDYIAREQYWLNRCSSLSIDEVWDLGHKLRMSCINNGGECSKMLKWALGLSLSGEPPTWLFFHTPSVLTFPEVQNFIVRGRPIMTKGNLPRDNDGDGIPDEVRQHMRVLSGFCIDPLFPPGSSRREWVYIYDPEDGPHAVTYNTWKSTATYTWAAPSIYAWNAARYDPPTIWDDAGDGSSLFDWIARFQNDPCVFKSVSCP